MERFGKYENPVSIWQMPNQIAFFEPIPPIPPAPAAPINFNLKPKQFKAQFVAAAVAANVPLPAPTFPIFVAAVLDSGYGVGPAQLVGCTPATWLALGQYLQSRLATVRSTLHLPAAGADWERAGFVSLLEPNEMAAAAYLLGMLYCRIATQQWATANGWGAVIRFWHYKVAEDKAVNFAAGAAVAAFVNSHKPDFLVQHGNGNWAAVEAKGTYGRISWGDLREGLGQASKFNAFQFVDPITGVLVPAPLNAHVCTLTYFDDANGTLQVLHLDPTGKVRRRSPSRKLPVLFREAADLVRFEQALAQHQLFVSEQTRGDALLEDSDQMLWARVPAITSVWVGLPRVLDDHQDALHWAVSALRVLTPVLARWRARESIGKAISEKNYRDLLEQIETRYTDSSLLRVPGSEAWVALANDLRAHRDDGEQPNWGLVLKQVWAAPLLKSFYTSSNVPVIKPPSIAALWKLLTRDAQVQCTAWTVAARLDDKATHEIYPTINGLLVVELKQNFAEKIAE